MDNLLKPRARTCLICLLGVFILLLAFALHGHAADSTAQPVTASSDLESPQDTPFDSDVTTQRLPIQRKGALAIHRLDSTLVPARLTARAARAPPALR